MEFFNSAVDVLQTLVIALGAGLAIWGVINRKRQRNRTYNPSDGQVIIRKRKGNRRITSHSPVCYNTGIKKTPAY
jgi:hypothetical protein